MRSKKVKSPIVLLSSRGARPRMVSFVGRKKGMKCGRDAMFIDFIGLGLLYSV